MSQLSTHRSSATAVLEVLFPNNTWRDLIRVLVWELYDALSEKDVYRWRVWGIPITVPRFLLEKFLATLIGSRP